MIERVVKSSWAYYEGSARNGWCYKVYYKSTNGWKRGRIVTYTDRQNLPRTVMDFVLNAGSVDTVYVPEQDSYNFIGLKRETCRA